IDYLILGQHFLENEMEGKYSGRTSDDEDYLAAYVDQVIEGIGTGVFTCVAHPDLMNYTGPQAIFDRHYARLIEAAKAARIPLEINLLGIRDHRAYPHERFFALCGEIGAEVCIGCDAHQAEVAVDEPSYRIAMEMAEKFGLSVNEAPALVPIR
ncbi:MAG: histidinol phosphate phosphatase, partial [Clostridiales bacterium]|nr:histidinol phosphate phosphatase [Clostridiales bacterium]